MYNGELATIIALFCSIANRQSCVICNRRFVYRFHRCPILLLEVFKGISLALSDRYPKRFGDLLMGAAFIT
jgi:hypothetical protein